MKRESAFFLKDILESIEAIERFTHGISLEQLKSDDKTSSAVVHKLEIIGEASKNIPSEIRKMHHSVPWSDMAKMRDKITHGYFDIDYEIVWKTIKERLPELKKMMRAALEEER